MGLWVEREPERWWLDPDLLVPVRFGLSVRRWRMPLREPRGWSMLVLLSVGDATSPRLCSPLGRERPRVTEERGVAAGD
jgi:hypothetical protein